MQVYDNIIYSIDLYERRIYLSDPNVSYSFSRKTQNLQYTTEVALICNLFHPQCIEGSGACGRWRGPLINLSQRDSLLSLILLQRKVSTNVISEDMTTAGNPREDSYLLVCKAELFTKLDYRHGDNGGFYIFFKRRLYQFFSIYFSPLLRSHVHSA